jgi:integrin-linked kinase-associated serine/threonine phosphatase 2C
MKLVLRFPKDTGKADLDVDLNLDELVEFVRHKVEKKEGVEVHRLIFRGVTLNDERSLRSYDVQENDMLIVQSKNYGLYRPQAGTMLAKRRKGMDGGQAMTVPMDTSSMMMDSEPQRASTEEFQALLKSNVAVLKSGESACKFNVNAAAAGEKGVRKQMEDEHLLIPSLKALRPSLPDDWDFSLFGVFDGHGGRQTALFVKGQLAFELAQAFELASQEASASLDQTKGVSDRAIKKAVRMACQNLDQRVAVEMPGCNDGATAIFALVRGEHVIVCNLGDSMAYLARTSAIGMESIPLQAHQHKCWVVSEKERILKTGGRVDNGRVNGILEVSRAFGDIPFKKYGVLCLPELMKFKVTGEDQFIVLACDGFWGSWSAEEAMEFTKDLLDSAKMQDTDLATTCKTLVKHVVEERQAQDNVSALVLELHC